MNVKKRGCVQLMTRKNDRKKGDIWRSRKRRKKELTKITEEKMKIVQKQREECRMLRMR